MKIHITNTYNAPGTPGIAQGRVTRVAREMGFCEMGIYKYPADVDNDRELGTRIDGIISALQHNDVVFIQSPCWNGLRYELRLVRKIKAYKNVKIVIFIHDLVTFLGNYGEEHLRQTVEVYNYADMIIVPSKQMMTLLQKYGLKVKKYMVQEMFDFPIEYEVNQPQFCKRLFFTGAPSRFPFVKEWRFDTPLSLYSDQNISTVGLNLEVRGYQMETKLLTELSEGGFGLIWSSDEVDSYYKMLQPYKIGNYLAAGIPVIIQKGLAFEKTILHNGIGYAVDSLEEADSIVQSFTEEKYNEIVKRVSEFGYLIKEGWFTRKMLTDAMVLLFTND